MTRPDGAGVSRQALAPGDVALWWTLRINDLIDGDRFGDTPTVPTTFALAAGERALAEGVFTVLEHRAAGDGSYAHDGGLLFAGGRAGLALSAGVAVARAAGNNARRRAAEEAAVARWRPSFSGRMTVTQLGFHLRHPNGLAQWSWDAIDSVELTGPFHLLMQGRSAGGPVSWLIESDWSPLAFTLWCRYRHPHHPQFVRQVWIPPGWAERVLAAGQALPADESGRWRIGR